jgi:hypothetical protein
MAQREMAAKTEAARRAAIAKQEQADIERAIQASIKEASREFQ